MYTIPAIGSSPDSTQILCPWYHKGSLQKKNVTNVPLYLKLKSRGQDLYFGTKVYGINEFQMPEKADWTKGPSLYGPYCSPMVYGIVALTKLNSYIAWHRCSMGWL